MSVTDPPDDTRRSLAGVVVAALGGALWFGSFGWPMVPPGSIDALMTGDWSQHITGFAFFRSSPWQWPVGRLPNFVAPVGTTIGFTDSIPLVALPLKLVEGVLPFEFQYLGLWLVACFAMVAAGGAWIARLVTPNRVHQVLVGLLVALAPTLMFRTMHPALCGHALLVFGLGLHVACRSPLWTARRLVTAATLLCWASALVHPYLAVMTLAVAGTAPLTSFLAKKAAWHETVVSIGASGIGCLGLFYAQGYIGHGTNLGSDGFGELSANLNTYFNPMGHSRLFPSRPTGPQQYEGFGWMGPGHLASILATVALCIVHRESRSALYEQVKNLRVAWVVCLLLFIFALSSRVLFDHHVVATAARAYSRLGSLPGALRSSGRFIWPLSYLLVLSSLTFLASRWRSRDRLVTAGLCVAVAFQAWDARTELVRSRFSDKTLVRFQDVRWLSADVAYSALALFPAQVLLACGGEFDAERVYGLAWLAAAHRWRFNSGYVARINPEFRDACERELTTVRNGALDPATIYVISNGEPPPPSARCGVVDGLAVCVAASNSDAFAEGLAE
jgi:hypothetical protein